MILNVFILSIYLAIASTVTFQDLEQQKLPCDIVIRGFLYQHPDGSWILAAEPNLHSCCIGAKHKDHSQVFLIGNFEEGQTNQIATLQGTLYRQDTRYVLHDVREISSSSSYKYLIIFVLILISIGYFLLKRFRSTEG